MQGCIYNDDVTKLLNGARAFYGKCFAHNYGRQIFLGALNKLKSTSKKSVYKLDEAFGAEMYLSVEEPFADDLRVHFHKNFSRLISLFGEFRNQINRLLSQYQWYPEYAENVTVLVRGNF